MDAVKDTVGGPWVFVIIIVVAFLAWWAYRWLKLRNHDDGTGGGSKRPTGGGGDTRLD